MGATRLDQEQAVPSGRNASGPGRSIADAVEPVPAFWDELGDELGDKIGDIADSGVPAARGLYDPALGKASCGVGFIADIKGRKSHKIVQDALTILLNLEHRGAVGADPRAGGGAGILTQIPHKFFRKKMAELGIEVPEPGRYAVGFLFMPRDEEFRKLI